MKRETVSCSVVSNSELTPGTYLIWLDAPDIATAKPGQVAMARCGADPTMTLRRPLSVHAVEKNRVAFLYRIVGKGTNQLSRLQKGETLDVLGPLGTGFDIPAMPSRLLLVAGGVGVAPLRFLASNALARSHEVILLLGARTSTEVYPKELLPPGTSVQVVTEDGSAGDKGMVTDLVPRFSEGVDRIYACGPEAMYRAMKGGDGTGTQGPPTQVSLEVRLGCGVGACYGCTVKTRNGLKRVCRDGPVFDLDAILWEAMSCLL